MELVTGAIAAGGGCVARAEDGRVVFVRHALPGERVIAEVTSETASFLRADAVRILEPSGDRVEPPCPHSGPGKCGGCDWQHVSLPVQRELKSALVSEQLRRLAGIDRTLVIEEVDGAPDGLGWRTRVRFAVDPAGRLGFHRHRSHDIEPVGQCPIAAPAVNRVRAGSFRWKGAHHVEVIATPAGGPPIVSVETGRRGLASDPRTAGGLVVDGRSVRDPQRSRFEVLGHGFEVSPGVFWQVHPGAPALLTCCVLEGLDPRAGERAADLYSGAGLFTVPLAGAVGPGLGGGARTQPPGMRRRNPHHGRSGPGEDRAVGGDCGIGLAEAGLTRGRRPRPGPGRRREAGDAGTHGARPAAQAHRLCVL